MDRRNFMGLAAAAATLAPSTALGQGRTGRARQLLQRHGVIDMLQVFTISGSRKPYFHTQRLSENAKNDFRRSGLAVMHHSVGIGGPDAFALVLRFLAAWSGFIANNSDVFFLAKTIADFDRAKAMDRIAVVLGLQCSDHFRSVEDVQLFHDLGQRCSQLTYNEQNWIGSGTTERVDGGVSDYGAEIIAAMNKVGMLVDVSHCGDRTTLDAIAISEKPIAITHSNPRALSIGQPRCKTDEAIKALAAKGGVMGITGVRNYVKGTEPTTIEDLTASIDHVVQLVGIDHVGLGTDADLYGYDDLTPEELKRTRESYKPILKFRDKFDVDGFDDPLRFEHLVEALVKRGYSEANIAAVLGANFRRLLTQVWA